MSCKSLIFVLLACLNLNLAAEVRRFQNADETQSFFAELIGYEAQSKRVSVKLKNGRIQHFSLDILSEDDKTYVIENGKRLAVGNDIRVTLKSYQDKTKKALEPRIVNRVYPSGYSISLNNRSKKTHTNLTINYTLYYAVQGYLKPERKREEKEGTLTCEKITAQGTVSLKTESIDIISGKLEPIIKNVRKKNAQGEEYIEPVVEKPGGRRKDLLLGCKVEIVVDGAVVKTVIDGTIAVDKPDSP